jgi:hypothetical protein
MITLEETCDAFRAYALAGARFYRDSFSEEDRRMVGKRLANQLQVSDPAIEVWFGALRSGGQPKPILFPTPQPNKDMHGAFFTVARQPNEAGPDLSVTLVFWTDAGRNQTMAFRLEPADPVSRPHSYAHVQITRNVIHPPVQTTLASWVPESFPGFPTGCRTPSDYFFSTLAAVHGYAGAAQNTHAHQTLQKSFANSPPFARKLVQGMEQFFN